MTITRALGLHTAHLDPITGTGVIVCPSEAHNVYLVGPSVNEADWDQAVRDLHRIGWEPLYADGQWIVEGHTPQGCPVLALYCTESIPVPSLPQLVGAHEALMTASTCVG